MLFKMLNMVLQFWSSMPAPKSLWAQSNRWYSANTMCCTTQHVVISAKMGAPLGSFPCACRTHLVQGKFWVAGGQAGGITGWARPASVLAQGGGLVGCGH